MKCFKYYREGMDSRILRFKARMVSKSSDNSRRNFIICYYLCDNTISVHEISDKYSGTYNG